MLMPFVKVSILVVQLDVQDEIEKRDIENQNGHNPHDQLSEVESAKIIIDHVKEGVELAKKYRLPKILIDFITTHHGTTRTEYFYRNFLKNNPDIPVVLSDFCYPGPKPTTKEQTILLLADSVEAASKSLKNPKLQEISDLVDNIISYTITHEQLTESDLTFEELESCRSVFKQLLKFNFYDRDNKNILLSYINGLKPITEKNWFLEKVNEK